jgi:hypothetical protein
MGDGLAEALDVVNQDHDEETKHGCQGDVYAVFKVSRGNRETGDEAHRVPEEEIQTRGGYRCKRSTAER